jgi:putative membrane protein
MRRVWRIFCLDVKHATKNVISLIVCIGLVVIPSLYAWFNIAGSWDPYGNTGNLKVAVANSDAGYKSDTIPVKINLGERVASNLSQKKTIGYVVTTEEDALEGVRSGEYYAAIVIPEDFTKDMLTVFSDDIQQATIVYYSNQKENAIAPIVTDKAATSVKNSVQADFAQSLGEMGAGALSEISGYVSDDQLLDISESLSDAISRASTDLRTVSAHMGVYSSLLSSAGSIIDSSSTLLSGTDSSTQDVRNALAESARGVRKVGDSVDSATAAIDEALSTSKQSFDSVSDAVDTAFDAAQTDASDGASKLRDIASRIDAHADAYQELDDSLTSLQALLPDESKSLLDPTISRVEGVISTQRAMAERLRTSATNLENGVSDAKQDHEDVKALIEQDSQEIEDARSTFDSDLRTQLSDLANSIDTASTAANTVSIKLEDTVDDVSSATSLTSGDLADMKTCSTPPPIRSTAWRTTSPTSPHASPQRSSPATHGRCARSSQPTQPHSRPSSRSPWASTALRSSPSPTPARPWRASTPRSRSGLAPWSLSPCSRRRSPMPSLPRPMLALVTATWEGFSSLTCSGFSKRFSSRLATSSTWAYSARAWWYLCSRAASSRWSS